MRNIYCSYRKNVCVTLLFLFIFLQAGYANIADPTPATVTQPDGTQLTIRLHGDEFYHFNTTLDGYTILKNPNNFYVYAERRDGRLVPGKVIANNKAMRQEAENRYLEGIEKYMTAPKERVVTRTNAKQYVRQGLLSKISSSGFRGIIILAQFSDRSFSITDYPVEIRKMINDTEYTGNGATGSVRDYFYDSSMGGFEPQFDIVGPVTLDYKQTDADGANNGQALVKDACLKADQFVNFADYDLDGDNSVDMIYVIFAGAASSYAGNNEKYLWPHAYALNSMAVRLDGVYCNRYACSTELTGGEMNSEMDGIGTVCHEFSHVLGLPDFYDTDYEKSGGVAPHPGDWSLMASGSYLNNSKTPPSYSAYERYMVGWGTSEKIEGPGNYELPALNISNKSYFFPAQSSDEYFYLENRQQTKWDAYLPGHGMLVYRVDLTNESVWNMNTVNNNPDHMYYELLCADNNAPATAGNAFPGSLNVKELTDETMPSLRSWTGIPTEKEITGIKEDNGIISFTIQPPLNVSYVEDFENIQKETWTSETMDGTIGKWIFSNARTYATSEVGVGNGSRVASVKNGKIEMETDITGSVKSVSILACKSGAFGMKNVRIEVSEDKGASWKVYGENILLSSNVMETYTNRITMQGCLRFRIVGVASAEAYIDDFQIKCDLPDAIEDIQNIGSSLKVYRFGQDVIVHTSTEGKPIEIYSVTGMKIAWQESVSGKCIFRLPEKGMYIIRQAGESLKILY